MHYLARLVVASDPPGGEKKKSDESIGTRALIIPSAHTHTFFSSETPRFFYDPTLSSSLFSDQRRE